jgi:hypothetical protein
LDDCLKRFIALSRTKDLKPWFFGYFLIKETCGACLNTYENINTDEKSDEPFEAASGQIIKQKKLLHPQLRCSQEKKH